jgi:hypothetical protein
VKKANILPVVAIACLALASILFAKEEAQKAAAAQAGPSKQAPPKAKAAKDMTTEELAAEIADILDTDEEIGSFIPGLKKEKDNLGKTFYTYNGVKLERLDRGKLEKLFIRVRQERVRIRTERITRQLESIRQAQAAAQGRFYFSFLCPGHRDNRKVSLF